MFGIGVELVSKKISILIIIEKFSIIASGLYGSKDFITR